MIFFGFKTTPVCNPCRSYNCNQVFRRQLMTDCNFLDLWRDHHTRFVELSFFPGPDSEDIKFEAPVLSKVGNRVLWSSCGKTKDIEDDKYQEERSTVCAYWTHPPSHLVVPRRGKLLHTFIMTVDTKREVALKEMIDGKNLNTCLKNVRNYYKKTI